ncbi:MAG TPA: hypothetical protein VIC25_05385 [Caulobacteraceae bacterium]|jgi:hypothetical protein
MLSATSPVVVHVTDEALREVAPPALGSPTIYAFRGVFEQIADRKFMRQEFDDDGAISIKSADIKYA